MTIFNTTISSGDDYLVHVNNYKTGLDDEFNFMTYEEAYNWSKSQVVLSKGFVTVGIYKNDNRICCMAGSYLPWHGDDIVSVWTFYKGGTKIKMNEKIQCYVDESLHN